MKLILIFLAGALPLAVVTVNFFLPVNHAANANPAVVKVLLDTKEMQKTTDIQSADLAKEAAGYVDRLRQVDLFSTREIPPTLLIAAPTTGTGTSLYSPAFKGWENARKTHNGVTKFVNLASTKSPRPSQEVLGEMQQFATSAGINNPLSGVPGVDRFVSHVDVLCGQLNSKNAVEEQLKKADELLTQENYPACLLTLKSVNRTGLTGLTLKAYQECERKALWGKWWTEKPKTTATTKAASEERKTWRRKCPEAVLMEERDKLEQVNREYALMDCVLDRDQLRDSPPPGAREYLRKASEIIMHCPDTRPALRSQFGQWLGTKMPVLAAHERTKLLGEAESPKGKLKVGVFRPADGFYKYWSSIAEFQKPDSELIWKDTYLVRHIVAAPRDPFYVRAAVEFTDARKKLLTRWESEADWRDFSAVCERLDRDFKQYRDRGGLLEIERATGAAVPELKFEDATSLATEVLSEWEAVKNLIGER